MNFIQLTESEYRKFWEKSPQKCFLSAPEIAHLHENARVFYLGVKNGTKLVAAVMVRGTKRPWGYDYYAPRGPLMDYSDSEVVKFFLPEIKKFLRAKNGYIFRMDPNLELIERDIDGQIVLNGKNNEPVVKLLKQLGLKKSEYIKNISQITWQFVLPVAGKTEKQLLSDMKTQTRQRLKRALDLGIKTKSLSYDELQSFYDILVSTAKRKHFQTRDFDYFQKMYQLFSPRGEIDFVSAVINPAEAIARLSKKLETEQAKIPQTIREKKDRADAIKSLQSRIEKLRVLFPNAENQEITLSSGMFMTAQPEILHLLGGNVGEYMKLDAQYVLQWDMIRRAVKNGYQKYNFYGIPEDIDTHPADYGIYEFKRGFSGHVEQLIGEYELPLSSKYYLHKLITNCRKIYHK